MPVDRKQRRKRESAQTPYAGTARARAGRRPGIARMLCARPDGASVRACWHSLFPVWGEGAPRALLSMPVRLLRRLTGTACGPPVGSPPALAGFPFPPSPPSLLQRAFAGKSQGHEASLLLKANEARSAYLSYMLKLFVKFTSTGLKERPGVTSALPLKALKHEAA